MRILILSAAVSMLWAVSARAEDAPQPDFTTLQKFGRDMAACMEWSDGCSLCIRLAAGEGKCSTPGIACQPGPVTCRVEKPKSEAPPAEAPKDPPK